MKNAVYIGETGRGALCSKTARGCRAVLLALISLAINLCACPRYIRPVRGMGAVASPPSMRERKERARRSIQDADDVSRESYADGFCPRLPTRATVFLIESDDGGFISFHRCHCGCSRGEETPERRARYTRPRSKRTERTELSRDRVRYRGLYFPPLETRKIRNYFYHSAARIVARVIIGTVNFPGRENDPLEYNRLLRFWISARVSSIATITYRIYTARRGVTRGLYRFTTDIHISL